ncbi:hypothetical protein, partial [Nostoc sp. 'Peltigera membranacea cyanobiont' 232]|uniref:hypothetical protein n=1 Tax=Nostoc sp. 'Peltigera membranacea cyanobiont' 232 TaxID=2014531 RepID=UPI001CB8E5D6
VWVTYSSFSIVEESKSIFISSFSMFSPELEKLGRVGRKSYQARKNGAVTGAKLGRLALKLGRLALKLGRLALKLGRVAPQVVRKS